MLGCGDKSLFQTDFLLYAYQHIRQFKGLCIADEVQVGFGRVGKYFWGFELQRVISDIVTLGKLIGNGHPIGAVITTHKIAENLPTEWSILILSEETRYPVL